VPKHPDPAVNEQCFAWESEQHGVDVARYDTLTATAVGDDRDSLVEARADALAAYEADDMILFDRCLEIMFLRATLFEIVPLGRAGHNSNRRQRERRLGKPSSDPTDTTRHDRIRAHHARLVAEGRHDATSATAAEFNLSTRQIRTIVSRGKDPQD